MNNEHKNQAFRTILQERLDKYVLAYGAGKSWDAASNVARGKAFSEFYVRDILCRLEPIDEDDIDWGLQCDGKDDLNVDCVLQSDETFFIFQSKFKGQGKRPTNDEFAGFFSVHERLLNPKLIEEKANKYLRQAVAEFAQDSDVKYFFITNAPLSEVDDLRKEFDRQREIHSKRLDNPDNVSWELISGTELRHNYDRAQGVEVSTPPLVEIPLEKTQGQTWGYLDLSEIVDPDYPSVICTVKGTVLKSLYEHHKSEIFNWNIRHYLGQNPVNKKITKTIKESPEQFYYFNNGISAICTTWEVAQGHAQNEKVLKCRDFQIINGAQTTMCLAKFDDPEKLKRVRVLLRVTKTEDIRKASKGLNREIIACNNNQTVIKQSDFRSNDDVQLFLEKELAGKNYKGVMPSRTLRYLRKRQEPKKLKTEKVINMETLAKAVHSFRYNAIAFLQKANCLYDMDTKNGGRYNYVFGNEGEEAAHLSNEKVLEICAICFIWFKLDDLLGQKKQELKAAGRADSIEFLSYLPKWHYLWAYGELLRTLHDEKLKNVYTRIVDGRAFEVENSFVTYWFDEISHKILECVEDAHASETDANGTSQKGFNYKNWVRNVKSFEKVRRKFANPLARNFPCNI
jgi:hypothetical protein